MVVPIYLPKDAPTRCPKCWQEGSRCKCNRTGNTSSYGGFPVKLVFPLGLGLIAGALLAVLGR